jgi:tetratricopeptide (TPR) repeat protein
MAEAARESGKLRVFISYSRDDFGFADQLVAALAVTGFEPSIDRHEISGGEDWKRRLGGLIREADTVVFVLSPASAQSSICAWEVDEAARLGKRILPVVCRPLEGTSPPPHLQSLNYVFFCADEEQPGTGFGTGLTNLVAALNTDLDWLREHTRLLQRATEWDTARRPDNRLLSGADIEEAKAWVARQPRGAAPPTALHLDFIRASEAAEQARASAEGQRLAEMAAAQDARAKALAEAEKAVAREAEAQRDRARAQKVIVWGSASAALVLAVAAGFGWWQQRLAKAQYLRAERVISLAMENARELADDAIKSKDIPRPVVRKILTYTHSINDDLVRIGETSPERDLASNLEKLADLQLADGDRAGARAKYEEALVIRDKLTAAEPANTQRRGELAVSLQRLADLRRADGDRTGALPLFTRTLSQYEKLTADDPTNAQWLRGTGILNERIGSVLRDEGDRAGALPHFQKSLAIYEKLAARDPADTRFQDGTGIAIERIASIRRAEGDRAAALALSERRRAIYERLAANDPASSRWQSSLAGSLAGIADLRREEGDRTGALAAYRQLLPIRERLAASTEGEETKSDGRPGRRTAAALIGVAWYALFTRDFAKALSASERAHSLDPDSRTVDTNRAHALLFLERGDDAKALYAAHKGKRLADGSAKTWEQAIAEDFAALRQVGLEHALMGEIEADLRTASAQ